MEHHSVSRGIKRPAEWPGFPSLLTCSLLFGSAIAFFFGLMGEFRYASSLITTQCQKPTNLEFKQNVAAGLSNNCHVQYENVATSFLREVKNSRAFRNNFDQQAKRANKVRQLVNAIRNAGNNAHVELIGACKLKIT